MGRSCSFAFVLALFASSTGLGQTPSDKSNLDGTWEITAMIDDGKLVNPQTINESFVQNRRLTISGQTMTVSLSGSGQPKTMVFVTDTTKSPATFDLAGTEKTGSKGIFLMSGDTLMICLADPTMAERPSGFISTAQSKTMLLTLQRVPNASLVIHATETKPANVVAQQPVSSKETKPVKVVSQQPVQSEDQMRTALAGTWGHQNKDAIVYVTLNGDGSMSAVKTWKSSFKRTFQGEERSSGNWKLQDGVVIVNIATSTEKDRRNQVYSFRIRSLNSQEIICVDQDGQLRREWKVR